MNWFTQLFSKRRAAALPVSFDTTGWTLVTSDDTRAEWTSAAGDTLSARVDTSTDEASAAAADIE